MKIYTITFHRAHNYGAVLQAYALQQYLLARHVETKIIDYTEMQPRLFYKVYQPSVKNYVKKIYHNMLVLMRYRQNKKKYNQYELFIENRLIKTKTYKTFAELFQDEQDVDCIIAGGDQLWNMTYRISPEFFLDFWGDSIQRVAYSVSMGMYDLDETHLNYFTKRLKQFDEISVREEEAKKYIEDLGFSAEVTLDPVFLKDSIFWEKLMVKPQIKDYILCYPIIHNSLMQETVNQFRAETGLSVVILSNAGKPKIKGDYYVCDAGPEAFLGYIYAARYVLTTSYHGTAFSIIFRKDFFAFISDWAPSRITNLLKKLELEDRQISGKSPAQATCAIDYRKVDQKLDPLKESSMSFLDKVMNGLNDG